MRFRAFKSLRPEPAVAAQVASLPYDVVSRTEARTLAGSNELSFLRVVRAELELPDAVDPYADVVYERAHLNFQALIDNGHLVREDAPMLYVYQQKMGDHTQAGIVGVCHVDDYENNIIRKHEKTRPAKENDRTRLNRTLSANPGPVFLTYRSQDRINRIVEDVRSNQPLFDFTAPDGVQHTVWRFSSPELVRYFEEIPVAYVADGHHRSASAARTAKERREANPSHTGEEDYNWFLSVLFPHDTLRILPYNRVVADLNGMTPEAFLEKASAACRIQPAEKPEPRGAGFAQMYLAGKWHEIDLNPAEVADDPIRSLDVSRLHDLLLEPVLGIGDERTDERIDFVGGIRGTRELEKRVDAGDVAVAFSMHPVDVEQLMAIADAGAIMPPKSTWFEPKLRSGLLIHTF